MSMQLDIIFARKERDAGILQAVTNADRVNNGWSDLAYTMFKDWLSGWVRGHSFTIETFRVSAEIRGLEKPPSSRAYGHIAVRAKKEGLIKSNGTVKVSNPRAHMANAALWIKL